MRCAVLSAILVLAVSGGYAAQKPQSSDASGNGSAVDAPPAPSPSPAVSPDLNSDDEKAAEPVEEAAKPSAGTKVHRVWIWQETRDCLWNLAERYYGDPWQWKKIYLANQEQIEDPRVIFPKQELIIPPLEEGEKGK